MTDALPLSERADGFDRCFSEHVERWSARSGAPRAAQRLAARFAQRLLVAMDEGHVCLEDENLKVPDTVSMLVASCVVGMHDEPGALPLLLDGHGRLYLHRLFDHERQLARALTGLAAAEVEPPHGAAIDLLRSLFDPADDGQPDWQQIACASALSGRLLILSGGPGTGKTTTVVKLLAVLLAQDPSLRIALCAPTGKAAARLADSVQARGAELPEAIRARLPQAAATVHRLLGYQHRDGRFRYNARNPLDCNVLVVDEASMLDLAMARRLVDALPTTGRLILIGDKDQLASVEAGSVFSQLSARRGLDAIRRTRLAELCGLEPHALADVAPVEGASLANRVCWLSRNFRFKDQPDIGALATAVRDGAVEAAIAQLRSPTSTAIEWIDRMPGERQIEALLERGFAGYFALLRAAAHEPAALFGALQAFRVLCAQRQGPAGADIHNRVARRILAAVSRAPARGSDGALLAGELVMMRRNDYELELFNGDLGIALPDEQGQLQVVFERGPSELLRVPIGRVPHVETAFAMTIHKSQGSEFDEVLVVLPSDPGPLCTRELLYTGLTRARRRLTIAAPETVVRHAIATATRRSGGLPERLEEAAALRARAAPGNR